MPHTRAMSSHLQRAIDSLSGSDTSLPDALRALLVVAQRIEAEEMGQWLRKELRGYSEDDDFPQYRICDHLPVHLHFVGMFSDSQKGLVYPRELPKIMREALNMRLSTPIAEIVELRSGENEPAWVLPSGWVAEYRLYAEKGEVPHYPAMELNGAKVKLPRTYLAGIVDQIKTTALELALGLEGVSTAAGDVGGPTLRDEPDLERQVTVHLTQLLGNVTALTAGDNSTFTVADSVAIASGTGSTAVGAGSAHVRVAVEASKKFLDEEAAQELAAALEADGGRRGEQTRRFLERLKRGAVSLVGGVGVNAAYEGVVALLQQVPGV